MDELRALHLGKKAKGSGPTVLERLTEAFLAVRAKQARRKKA